MFGGQVLGLFDEVGDRYSSEGAGAVAVCVFIVAEELNDIVLILLYNRLPYRIIRNKAANKMRVVCWVEAARQLIGVCVVDPMSIFMRHGYGMDMLGVWMIIKGMWVLAARDGVVLCLCVKWVRNSSR